MVDRRWFALAVAATAAVALVAACSLSGLDEKFGLGEGGAGGDANANGCAQTENCTNGIDDDCNGLVDCEDPACTTAGFACTASAVPAGWTLVAFSASTRPLCPAGFGVEREVVSNVAGAVVTCECTCAGSTATCGGTALYDGYPNACATGATGVNLAVNNGVCGTTTQAVTSGDYYQLYFNSVPQAKQGACTGTGKIIAAPPPTFAAGAICGAPPSLGAGCASGVCAPPSSAQFKTCILHPGAVACPAFGFSARVLASTGNPGFVDDRVCSGCPCATSLSCGVVTNVALFTNGTCAGGATYNINTGCQLANSNASIGSYKVSYPTTGDAGCKPTGPSSPDGGVALDDATQTICCAP